MFQVLFSNIKTKPKFIFLLDGFGALCTAFGMGYVWTYFQKCFGFPVLVSIILGSVALFFAVYSFLMYFLIKADWGIYLKAIAIANLLYVVTSLGLAFYYRTDLTQLAWAYLFLEILIVAFLVRWEWKIADK